MVVVVVVMMMMIMICRPAAASRAIAAAQSHTSDTAAPRADRTKYKGFTVPKYIKRGLEARGCTTCSET